MCAHPRFVWTLNQIGEHEFCATDVVMTDDDLNLGRPSPWGSGVCHGDSGSPLFIIDPNLGNQVVIIGVVSRGTSCAIPNYPAIYTRVKHYTPFIQAYTK